MTCSGNCGACTPPLARAVNQPEEGEATLYGDVWVKPWRMPDAGMLVPQHAHTYPHQSFIARGAVRVWQDGKDMGVARAPAAVRVPARVKHAFEVLEADTLILCIHNAAHGEAADIHEEHHLMLEG